MSYENILTHVDGRVAVIQLNRPKALNALNGALMNELTTALAQYDADDNIGCMVVTGNDRSFAAGADIKQMANATVADMMNSDFINYWDKLKPIRKPIIAVVSGFAFGGGNELAMACDLMLASETAQFGQPEINLGIIPGAGGTQRLTLAVGKAVAMEMVLNDRRLSAAEALQYGLVSRVFPKEVYMEESMKIAHQIANRAPLGVQNGKAAVNAIFEMNLASGVAHERTLFYSLFATDDQKEGMDAFVNKRKPEWSGK